MKKGIIMEIDDAFLTLLTPEGEFLRTKKQNQIYTIGEEIHFFPMTTVQTRKSLFLFKNIFTTRSVWAVIAALVILFGSSLPLLQNNKAYAYMSIDANSSIELGVNKKMQVVKITGFNKEGKKVISELKDWKKEDVTKITKSILIQMKQARLLEDNQKVIISTVRAKDQDEQSEKELQKNIAEIKSMAGKEDLDLTLLNATEEDRVEAHSHGVSTGKYQADKSKSLRKEKKKNINVNQSNNKVPLPQNEVLPPGQQKKMANTPEMTKPVTQDYTKDQAGQSKAIPPGQQKKAENQVRPKQAFAKPQIQNQTKQQTKQPTQPKQSSNGKNHSMAKGPSANNSKEKLKGNIKNNNHK
ncbi:anti-sigma factor domain-containing protein [Neobacillus vireti]|uniref:anti-sigma factor domain-containing protein n=1 Tax=Neobacillus vireti TaxID=220686 RepID=UPI003000130E